jgi:hypothetical protein
VIYGTTTAYGSASPTNTTAVMAHVVTLTGLTQAAPYHYRVLSRDAAGNLGMTADLTFATTGATQLSLAP